MGREACGYFPYGHRVRSAAPVRIGHFLANGMQRSSKLGAILSMPALKAFKKLVDPGEHNGASMVGLNGVVIKSHGSADAYAFGNALRVAVIEARKGVPTQIIELLQTQTLAPQVTACTATRIQES